MKLADRLEDTLNGRWSGLHGEVVTHDCYRIGQLDFIPELVFDIGANVGTFTRFAKFLFPQAVIVAVEPDPLNVAHFRKFTKDPGVTLIEAAIGSGKVWKATTAANGSGEVYMSAGIGYPVKKLEENPQMVESEVWAVPLSEIMQPRWKPGLKTVLKIDCEGSENQIFGHLPSLKLLHLMDYIAMEIHRYAADGQEQPIVNRVTNKVIEDLRETHRVEVEGVHLWARLKET